jgi:hypothetical protein
MKIITRYNIQKGAYQRIFLDEKEQFFLLVEYGLIGSYEKKKLRVPIKINIEQTLTNYLKYIKLDGFEKPDWNNCLELKLIFSLEMENDYSDLELFEGVLEEVVYQTGNGQISDTDCGINRIAIWIEIFDTQKAIDQIITKLRALNKFYRLTKIESVDNDLNIEIFYDKE